jgi:serine/threonine-protein kinase PknG
MAQQLTAVLREVLSLQTRDQHPGTSTMFAPELRVPSTTAVVPSPASIIKALPLPLIDRDDPGAVFLAGLGAADFEDQEVAIGATNLTSPEIQLRHVFVKTVSGRLGPATSALDQFETQFGGDWRTFWYRGLIALANGRPDEARTLFTAVYDALPGEAAPKLAIAACAELMQDFNAASQFYEIVWRTDHSYVSAAFGLARVNLEQGNRNAAVAVFDAVPETSTHHTSAQEAALRALLVHRVPGDLSGADLGVVDTRFAWLANRLDPEHLNRLALEVLDTALKQVEVRVPADVQPGQKLIGRSVTERDLRFGLEEKYRALARLAGDRTSRIDLVDLANSVRPRTLV